MQTQEIQFNYYYGKEADQFSFLKIPKVLIKDKHFKGLSNDAKLLYSLMLDRMALSTKNGWCDKENRVYIVYAISAIMEDLGCGKDKAIKVLCELDTVKGVGLIEKKRRGFGKPDIIYIKNFILQEDKTSDETDGQEENPNENQSTDTETENETTQTDKNEFQKSEKQTTEVDKTDLQKSEKPTTEVGKVDHRSRQNRPQEVGKTDSNNTNINNTNISDTNLISSININEVNKQEHDEIDNTNTDTYMQIIKANIEYDSYMQQANDSERQQYEELFQTITDVVCVSRKTVRIAGEQYPYALVKARFLKLKSSHLQYVMDCMRRSTTKICNIKAYLITALYNSIGTITHYYQQEQQHDTNDNKGNANNKYKPNTNSNNRFNNFPQRDIDIDELERKLLGVRRSVCRF